MHIVNGFFKWQYSNLKITIPEDWVPLVTFFSLEQLQQTIGKNAKINKTHLSIINDLLHRD